MQYSQKLENLLIISLEADNTEIDMLSELSAGVDIDRNRWEIIVRYYAESEKEFADTISRNYPDAQITLLLCNYCIIVTSREDINRLAQEPMIEYIEKPKVLYYDMQSEKRASCIPDTMQGFRSQSLSGAGVITAVIDTGINVGDEAFRNKDGTTRIIRLWNQQNGKIYTDRDINDEFQKINDPERFDADDSIFYDSSRHGINVCKIACGNQGVAYNSDIIFVKLKRAVNGYSNTTDMMRAIDYCIRTAADMGKPVAVNISYGSNYGSHLTDDIQTSYINDVCGVWKNVICAGSGNEAGSAVHMRLDVEQGKQIAAELAVREYEKEISFAVWMSALDDIRLTIISPDGSRFQVSEEAASLRRMTVSGTDILMYRGEAKPYSATIEQFVSLTSREYVASGLWRFIFDGRYIKNGSINIWLSSSAVLNNGTGFLRPSPELTFTIPSTAEKVITVGAYNAATDTPSAFSGRGYVTGTGYALGTKPDIVAPGENVSIDENTVVSGTSFAVPFVTGSAALLMEWGDGVIYVLLF